mmetsp:Transcript_139306/g.267115  ORF Transcript_139306/g.267115 Transcript_139306/m.267115 type:complete len:281 (-) Transcript_139306:70-912(-)
MPLRTTYMQVSLRRCAHLLLQQGRVPRRILVAWEFSIRRRSRSVRPSPHPQQRRRSKERPVLSRIHMHTVPITGLTSVAHLALTSMTTMSIVGRTLLERDIARTMMFCSVPSLHVSITLVPCCHPLHPMHQPMHLPRMHLSKERPALSRIHMHTVPITGLTSVAHLALTSMTTMSIVGRTLLERDIARTMMFCSVPSLHVSITWVSCRHPLHPMHHPSTYHEGTYHKCTYHNNRTNHNNRATNIGAQNNSSNREVHICLPRWSPMCRHRLHTKVFQAFLR